MTAPPLLGLLCCPGSLRYTAGTAVNRPSDAAAWKSGYCTCVLPRTSAGLYFSILCNILHGCEALACVNKCLLSVTFILGLRETQELRRDVKVENFQAFIYRYLSSENTLHILLLLERSPSLEVVGPSLPRGRAGFPGTFQEMQLF